MEKQSIINTLISGIPFSGRNGAFEGMMYPKSVNVEKDTMVVECQKDGHSWEETWDDLTYTIYAFQRGDYFFVEEEDDIHTKDDFVVTINIVDDVEPNEDGFYVEVEIKEQKVTDFCIHPEDCDCSDPIAVMEYARDYVQNLELKWDGKTYF